MSELDDLVAVFGGIDDAVAADPSLRPKVAAMLPPYRQPAHGWYRALQDWQQVDGNPTLAEYRDVGEALNNLQDGSQVTSPPPDDHEAWASRNWLNARRMLASATLSRIPGSVDTGGADPRSLVRGLAADATGQQLHSQLRRAGDYPGIRAWPKMMADTRAQSLVDPTYDASTYVPPLPWDSGSFRVVSSQIKGTSVALRTHLHVTKLDLVQAKQCLDPAIWKKYQPPWCDMIPLGAPPGLPGVERYRELIAADCGQNPKLSTVLDFLYQDVPDGGGILQYRIPDGPAVGGTDGFVTIDEGSLEVRPARAPYTGIHFVTTKRIQFESLRQMPTMTAAGLGFLVWVLGWDTLAERFIYYLARIEGVQPSVVPTAQADADSTLQDLPSDGGIMALLELGISGWENSLRKCIGSVRSSVQQAASGNYGLADYLSDLTTVSNEVTTTTTALASMGAQMWRAVANAGGPEDGGGTGPAAG